MHYSITINKLESLEEIKGYWTDQDFLHLLGELDVDDAATIDPAELWDYFVMAITELDPDAAAALVLTYRLGEKLNEGQIQNISHEMLEDKIAEEYPDIALHYALFNINELLYKAYNGKFPRTLATQLTITWTPKAAEEGTPSKEKLLKSLAPLLSDRSPIKRLFEEQLKEGKAFEDAAYIIWELKELGDHQYRLTTSDYWINREDIVGEEFSQ